MKESGNELASHKWGKARTRPQVAEVHTSSFLTEEPDSCTLNLLPPWLIR